MVDETDCPVLFTIFNRVTTTRQVFDRIRQFRPKRLYVAADGPRSNREGEREACEATRNVIEGIDWDCELHTLYREENLGCKLAMSSAITWFFDNEEMGIILEDDCCPDPSFFSYCNALLHRYRDEKRVMMITGTNPITPKNVNESYFFSRCFSIWGWATWRRAWAHYDIEMKKWPKVKASKYLQRYYGFQLGSNMERLMDLTFAGKMDTWDFQWIVTCCSLNGLCITPRNNLISNIGLEGGHFTDSSAPNPIMLMKTRPIYINEERPELKENREADRILSASMTPNRLLTGIRYKIRMLMWKINPSQSNRLNLNWLLKLAWRFSPQSEWKRF